jgi:hypothetical protein
MGWCLPRRPRAKRTLTAMTWSERDLTRLALSAACRELSDLARAFVPTSSDGARRPGGLIEEASRLLARAERATRLAVAAERARGSSWHDIGAALGCTRQGAHERYAAAVDEISDSIMFRWRDGVGTGPGWSACPDGLAEPERTAAELDRWVTGHREPGDPDRGDRPVSGGLGHGAGLDAAVAVARVTELADQLVSGALPPGVSERTARRMLLEAKIHAYDLLAATQNGARAREAQRGSASAFDELVRWHRADVRDRLGHIAYCDTEAVITYEGRPVQVLQRHNDPADEEASGWLLCSIGDQSSSSRLSGPQLPAGLRAAILTATGLYGDGEIVAGVDAPRTMALAAALDRVCDHIAGDAARGYPPFAPGGIAGPPTA